MRRVITFIALSGLIVLVLSPGGHATAAQTSTGPVGQSSQLQLPASAFPTDYEEHGNEAWTASDADGSAISKIHSKSYEALGMLGAWHQYYAKTLIVTSNGVTYVGPVEVAYLGSVYPDTAHAEAAYADVHSSPILSNPVPCIFGTRCVTYQISLEWNGPTYIGYVRIIQQGNAVAEVLTDVFDQMSSLVSSTQFFSNLNGVSQAFVQDLNKLTPTSTPVPPTAPPTSVPTSTPTRVPTNTPTATPLPTATSMPTVIPLSFTVVSVRAERYGSKVDARLTRPALTRVKVGIKVYLSVYLRMLSAPAGTVATVDFRLTLAGRAVFHQTKQVRWSSPRTVRSTVTFKATKPGTYRFHGTVSVRGTTKQGSATLRVVK